MRIQDLALSVMVEGAHLSFTEQDRDFSLLALQGTEVVGANDTYAEVRPLGRRVDASLVAEDLDLVEGGHVGGALTISRERAGDQPANTATGEITLRFTAPIVGERLGESNLSVLGL